MQPSCGQPNVQLSCEDACYKPRLMQPFVNHTQRLSRPCSMIAQDHVSKAEVGVEALWTLLACLSTFGRSSSTRCRLLEHYRLHGVSVISGIALGDISTQISFVDQYMSSKGSMKCGCTSRLEGQVTAAPLSLLSGPRYILSMNEAQSESVTLHHDSFREHLTDLHDARFYILAERLERYSLVLPKRA
jgi:hypothetical protein